MNKKNWYWYLHWWYIFYLLDEKSHEYAYEVLWDCLTSNSNIYYLRPILDDNYIEFDINIILKTKSSVILESKIIIDNQIYVSSNFTFIKKR